MKTVFDIIITPPPPISSPEDWGAVAQGLGSLLQVIILLITAAIAIIQLKSWKRQEIGRKRLELAVQTMTTFYEIRDLFEYACNGLPYMRSTDDFNNKNGFFEDNSYDRLKYITPVIRFEERRDLFSKLWSLENSCIIVLTPEIKSAFEKVRIARSMIMMISTTLVSSYDTDKLAREIATSQQNQTLRKPNSDLEKIIINTYNEDNDVNSHIKNAVEIVERICLSEI